ncbi:hypothetical protein F2P56_032946 [Juglans regia]|uniref:PUM-HD domain-containing protein n=2 Tax=Juglans regia TaxID=51240 RepID=A0A833STV8_JUGRE|nr:putative pumilio homolog 7, chloroplastic [Juglans regia]KAF5447391.1 hypothetical protein F2P56_032946 [Juglans regia]
MDRTVNIIAAGDRSDRSTLYLDYDPPVNWGPILPNNEGNNLDVVNLGETLANTYLGAAAAAAAIRNNPTRFNASTSVVSDSNGWRETLREADTGLDAAAGTRNTQATRLNAGIRGLQIGGRESVNREGRIFQLMNDVDKQPLFNKLIESADVSLLTRFVAKIVSQPESLIKASLNSHGVKSVRKLIKVLGKTSLVSDMNTALCTDNGFYRLMTHPIGSSVILKCLDVASSEQNKLLYEAAIMYCLELAKHERGCINLKKFITSSRGQGRQQLLDFIAGHSLYLSQDPTGNYVLQHVLALHDPALTNKICSVLRGHYVHISLQKGGSHVVERCLESSGMEYVLGELLKTDNVHELLQLARNRYGNYVVQAALIATKRAGSPSFQMLLWLLQQHSYALQSGYGCNVLKLIAREDCRNKIQL